ncbi:3-isopropylmalate dehydratase large subunit|uniref:3-isopropylmalate dehydratase large subunit n=1 Tax=Dendrosporobacter quercicolus TaxID=146817 RepID=A0A1H0A241_9FIRM|nr:3-isopropylmalate dehydratase large subunit [Dendrosporobacter quercicolus]NSL49982.1 3-isopropylmalate dehydratase large subunit [Dendrosporobacter quercicolus DSM 1736]SDN27261.1 3-isopropylmalate dehydratase, large subunit [Dendrosporobacter quercicolus]
MGMTMTEKILARHAGLAAVSPGQLIKCRLDLVLGNDITSPPAIKEFDKIGRPVFDREKIVLVPDHFAPNKDIKSAEMTKIVREFARKHEIVNYFEVGRMGIEHVLLPEAGLVAPGEVIIGADSHTCTYGAVGAFATGVGSTDMGAAMATGDTWFKVPAAIKVELTGSLPKWVGGKDVILTLIGMIGVDGARYQSLEFTGGGLASLTMADRLTIANMAIEAGAKNGIFPVDDVTRDYLKDRVTKPYEEVQADTDAVYTQVVTIDLNQLTPVVALPHLPENVRPVQEVPETVIDQVIIGSCTNGRIEDLAQAAQVLAGQSIHPAVRAIIIPGSQAVYLEAMQRGFVETFIKAGAVVSTPTCGPCLGGYMGILAAGERAVATTNRNFRGRMGHVDSEVYLSGPYVAAASAVLGRIAAPEEVLA